MMRTRAVRVIVLSALVLATMSSASPALADNAERFVVPLSGEAVVPGPGDPDGTGGVFVFVDSKKGRFCFFADTGNISVPLTGVHLHLAPAGSNGPVVLDLHGPSEDPDVSGCFDIARDFARDILKHKDSYYIDIHNQEFPDGAVRGQLG